MPPRKKQKTEHTDTLNPVATLAPPRRTTRAMTKTALVPTPQSVRQPVASRARKSCVTGAAGKFRKGHLDTLPEIAVEIQLEIYSYLDLRDLHQLSRTCKRFREFFLGQKTVTKERLWEQARANTDDFPERPPFLSEPAFVHLLISPYCHRCGCTNVHQVIWAWFTRHCARCLREVTFNYNEADDYIQRRSRCKTGIFSYTTHGPFRLLAVVNPSDNISCRESSKSNRIHREHLEPLAVEWRKACPRNTPWFALRDIAQRIEQERRGEIEEREAYAAPCKAWFDEQERKRRAALDAARVTRFHEILRRLKEGGWEKEIAFMGPKRLDEMAASTVVRQAAKLTPKVWQDVYARLEGHLNDIRKERLTVERQGLLKSRFEMLEQAIREHYVRLPRSASMEYRPRALDFIFVSECRSLLEAENERTITRGDFSAILPAVTARWEAEMKEKLSTIMKGALPGPVADDVDMFSLAVAVFGCRCIGHTAYYGYRPGVEEPSPPRFPTVLRHDCLRKRAVYDREPPEDTFYSRLFMKRSMEYDVQPFEVRDLYRTPDVVAQACNILQTLGMDPLRTTLNDVKDCGARLKCLSCPEPWGIYAFTVETAINHACVHTYYFGKHDKWAPLDEEELALAYRLEAETHDVDLTSKVARRNIEWSCSLCLDFDERWPRMQEHYKTEHPDQDAEACLQNGTIFRHPYKSRKEQLKPPVQIRAKVQ
ncbi:hypothetical protein C8Q73DRAFT_520554 [Cubamyces lactineus]|nr:hypothetical protein C8Q73DRAFT_520554 [Cubamyces lactineus]